MSIKPYSPEWFWLRSNKIGASDSPTIMGENPWKSRAKLLQEKLGFIQPEPMNDRMQRGLDLEDKAREWFFNETGILVMPMVIISKQYEFAFASLDGIDPFGTTIVEIKCPSKKTHEMALKGEVPRYYMGQLQHQMCVAELDKCMYVSFDGEAGTIIEVKRNDVYIEDMLEKERAFYEAMQIFSDKNLTCPYDIYTNV